MKRLRKNNNNNNKNQFVSPSLPLVVLLIFILIATLVVVLVVFINSVTRDHIPKVQEENLGQGLPGYQYEFQACLSTCKSDWNLASDEKTLSDTHATQTASIPDERNLNNFAWAWGQFIAHDTALSLSDPESPIYHVGSMNLTRVQSHIVNEGTGCRKVKTFITPLIDATTIYGDYYEPDKLNKLRVPGGCKLKTQDNSNLLPVLNTQSFLAGDIRNSENPLLHALHLLGAREHNRLCDVLKGQVATWTEDERFWKARQIVIAKIQHITYEEWLPAILGSQTDLLDTVQEKWANGQLGSEFSNAAFRFGHSMVPNTLGTFKLEDLFFNIALVENYGIEKFIKLGLSERAQKVDLKFSNGMQQALFGAMDLVAINLFRGRDVTLSPYLAIASCYGTTPFFSGFQDPFFGMLAEPLVEGSSLPRTMAVIVAEQFKRWRKYDENYYTNPHIETQIGSVFLKEIKQTTLLDLIRKNTNIETLSNEKSFFI